MIVKRSAVAALFLCQFLFQSAATCQQLRGGERAPDFEAIDAGGDTIRLSDYRGQKVFVAFFRYAGCPVCNFRVHDLIGHYDSIRSRGYTIVAVYESTNAVLGDYLSESPAPFSVIGDPELKLYKAYGVERSLWRTLGSAFGKQPNEARRKGAALFTRKHRRDGRLTRMPADFLIDENGVLETVYYGKNIGDHLPISHILTHQP